MHSGYRIPLPLQHVLKGEEHILLLRTYNSLVNNYGFSLTTINVNMNVNLTSFSP